MQYLTIEAPFDKKTLGKTNLNGPTTDFQQSLFPELLNEAALFVRKGVQCELLTTRGSRSAHNHAEYSED